MEVPAFVDRVPVTDDRQPQPRAPASREGTAIVGDGQVAGLNADTARGDGRALAGGRQVHTHHGRQHDDVHALERRQRDPGHVEIDGVAAQRQVRRVVPIHFDPLRAAGPVQHDLRRPVGAAAGDVDAGHVQQQIAERRDVGEAQRVSVEGVAGPARQRPGGDREGKRREVMRNRVWRSGRGVAQASPGRIAGGRVGLGGRREGSRREPEDGRGAERCPPPAQAPARRSRNSVNNRTPIAVGPFTWWGPSLSV